MLKVKVNQQQDFTLSVEDGKIRINGKAIDSDFAPIGGGRYHALINHQSVTVELVKKDETGKLMELMVNGVKHSVGVEDEYDLLLKQLGMDKLMTHKVNEVKAPMPGLVLSVKVKVGEEVKKGDPLLTLEAMKMENIIKAPADAIIKSISVTEKTAVEKNQVLVVME